MVITSKKKTIKNVRVKLEYTISLWVPIYSLIYVTEMHGSRLTLYYYYNTHLSVLIRKYIIESDIYYEIHGYLFEMNNIIKDTSIYKLNKSIFRDILTEKMLL